MERIAKNKRAFLVSGIALLTIIIGLGIFGYFKVLSTDLFYEGITVEDYDLSFMSKEEALKFITNKKEKEIDDTSMKLTHEEEEYEVKFREIGFIYNYEDTIDELYSIGREGHIFKRIKDIIRARRKGININLQSEYSEQAIDKVVDGIAEKVDEDAKEAEFSLNGGSIQITEEVVGKEVNKEKLAALISDNINDVKPIEIPVEETTPEKTKELLSKINGVIGEFSTSFGSSTADRKENIRISAKAIKDRGVIMPGETVSFNDTTGPREKRFGYKEANVIIAGEFTPDVGGGVCQTSTTLYNALVRADVTIVERSPHSIPSTYVPFGQDAAVAYGYLDLKFKNNFDFPIYIDAGTSGSSVYFKVYGDKNVKNYTVSLDSQTIETIAANVKNISDGNLPVGSKEVVQQGRTGYRVNTYKSIIKNGKTVSRDLITKDYYKPREFIYRVGTKPAPAAPKNDNKDKDKDKKPEKPSQDPEPEKPGNTGNSGGSGNSGSGNNGSSGSNGGSRDDGNSGGSGSSENSGSSGSSEGSED